MINSFDSTPILAEYVRFIFKHFGKQMQQCLENVNVFDFGSNSVKLCLWVVQTVGHIKPKTVASSMCHDEMHLPIQSEALVQLFI